MVCKNCEEIIKSDFKYCPHCGERIINDFHDQFQGFTAPYVMEEMEEDTAARFYAAAPYEQPPAFEPEPMDAYQPERVDILESRRVDRLEDDGYHAQEQPYFVYRPDSKGTHQTPQYTHRHTSSASSFRASSPAPSSPAEQSNPVGIGKKLLLILLMLCLVGLVALGASLLMQSPELLEQWGLTSLFT